MRRLAFVAVLLVSVGCHGQVPPASNHVVNLTWTAPTPSGSWTGCTTAAPCVYGVYRCSASASTCASTTNTAWSEITSATTRVSGTSYSDSSANGLTAYYVVKTFQGTASSDPSNMAGPLTVPAVPLAPNVNGTVADLKPLAPVPSGEGPVMAMVTLRAVVR